METEERAAKGKWGKPGRPQKGWRCVSVEDLGELDAVCEMCETQQIRYVHHMAHPGLPGEELACGCVCAEHMSGDYVGPRQRERKMRLRAGFAERKGWRSSAAGNRHIKVDGYHMIVAKKRRGGYTVGVTPPGCREPTWGGRIYDTLEEAQKGCFDAMEWSRKRGW